ncbi:MAG: ATP synthase F0 subunit C [Candidatus Omnitrophota bacterium]
MDYKVALALSIPIGLGMAVFGSAIGLGKAVSSAMEATARQPEAAIKVLVNMTLGCAFIEALSVYALLIAFNLAGKI